MYLTNGFCLVPCNILGGYKEKLLGLVLYSFL